MANGSSASTALTAAIPSPTNWVNLATVAESVIFAPLRILVNWVRIDCITTCNCAITVEVALCLSAAMIAWALVISVATFCCHFCTAARNDADTVLPCNAATKATIALTTAPIDGSSAPMAVIHADVHPARNRHDSMMVRVINTCQNLVRLNFIVVPPFEFDVRCRSPEPCSRVLGRCSSSVIPPVRTSRHR